MFKGKPTLVNGVRSWSKTVASVAPRVRVIVHITSANGITFFSLPVTKATKSASSTNSQGRESTRPGASPAGKLERWDPEKLIHLFLYQYWNDFIQVFWPQSQLRIMFWITPTGKSRNVPTLKPNNSPHSSCTLLSVLFKTQNCLFESMAMTNSERRIWALQCNLSY